ncbi:MAG: hypothetical protein RIQ81_2617 [Pseudomonadota bacterium]|jgi:hypothetical protein
MSTHSVSVSNVLKVAARVLAVSAGLSLAMPALADSAGSVTAAGGVFYKMPSGELVKRDVTLEVPARGQGDVILRGANLELKAHGFKTVRKQGRSVFYVVFLNPPGAPENTAAVYRGSYLRGSNAAKYWGDVFSKVYQTEELAQLTGTQNVDAFVSDLEDDSGKEDDWRHAGGFWFGVDIGS